MSFKKAILNLIKEPLEAIPVNNSKLNMTVSIVLLGYHTKLKNKINIKYKTDYHAFLFGFTIYAHF